MKNHLIIFMPMESSDFEQDIIASLKVLRNDGIILYPTDTIWGIGCDATSEKSVQKIFNLKQRAATKTMIVLLADLRDLYRYTSHPDPRIFEYIENATRPTTVIFEGAVGFADNLMADDGTVAIRIVKDVFCRHLIKRLQRPLVSTSANLSGHDAPQNFSHIKEDIIFGVDYVVKYRQADQETSSPSAIVKFDKNGQPLFLRS
jgi:L-threonylcarbamoyladenylate synthase